MIEDLTRAELEEITRAAIELICSRKGWEPWGHDAFLYDRTKGFGNGRVYTTAEALRSFKR